MSAVAVLLGVVVGVISAAPALAETHPLVGSFGSFSDPNGIAVDER